MDIIRNLLNNLIDFSYHLWKKLGFTTEPEDPFSAMIPNRTVFGGFLLLLFLAIIFLKIIFIDSIDDWKRLFKRLFSRKDGKKEDKNNTENYNSRPPFQDYL